MYLTESEVEGRPRKDDEGRVERLAEYLGVPVGGAGLGPGPGAAHAGAAHLVLGGRLQVENCSVTVTSVQLAAPGGGAEPAPGPRWPGRTVAAPPPHPPWWTAPAGNPLHSSHTQHSSAAGQQDKI